MSTVEQRVREAFDALTLPEGLKERTLAKVAQEASAHAQVQVAKGDCTGQNCSPVPVQAQAQTQTQVQTQGQAQGQAVLPTQAPVKRHRFSLVKKGVLALAACLLLCVVGFGGYGVYAAETALVQIEVNPSLELGINRFDIVVAARAHNADGAALLESVSVAGKHYDEALAQITNSVAFRSYVSNTSYVDVSVICENEQQAESLLAKSTNTVESLPCETRCHRAGRGGSAEAPRHGTGAGRHRRAFQGNS